MPISARNQLTGKVKSVKEGIVTAEVVVELPGGQEIVSVITMTSVQNLGNAGPGEGRDQATEVMLAVDCCSLRRTFGRSPLPIHLEPVILSVSEESVLAGRAVLDEA